VDKSCSLILSDQYGRVLESKEIEVLYKRFIRRELQGNGLPARAPRVARSQVLCESVSSRIASTSCCHGATLCVVAFAPKSMSQLLIRLRTDVRSDSPPGSVGPAISIGASR
jgi:hypothetical protein